MLEEMGPAAFHPSFANFLVETLVGLLRPSVQEAFKEGNAVSTAAGELLYQLSLSNYDVVYKVVIEKNLIAYGNDEFAAGPSPSNAPSQTSPTYDCNVSVGLRGMAYLYVPKQEQLSALLDSLVNCIQNKTGAFRRQKLPHGFFPALALALDQAIWNWIDTHPLQFGKFFKAQQCLPGNYPFLLSLQTYTHFSFIVGRPDILFDYFDNLAATNSRYLPK